jgi:CubicO group peptidase (beta-lactamase class C family)
MMRTLTLMLAYCMLNLSTSKAQQLYFPPISASANWETITPESLGWCTNQLDSLYDFLGTNHTKAFLVLKDGKIVLEKYFGTFTKDSSWYWASAGKSLTAMLVGKAQEEGFLSVNDPTSRFLGSGWTSCTPQQEGNITIRNQLTMTSGLDDGVADNHCTLSSCLIYKADAGTRWAYHNAPYTLLDDVISAATGQSLNAYTQAKVKTQTGMSGLWITLDEDNVFFSTPRSMARYALLAQNNFVWDTDTLLFDSAYKTQMVNSSQSLNYSYGYLWWLNGKASYMVPTSQFVIPGSYAPNAPTDMFAAIGKNGQIASISQNKGLIMIRMGDPPGTGIEVPTQFCDQIWLNLNKVICNNSSGLDKSKNIPNISVYPNPASSVIYIQTPLTSFRITLSNRIGETVGESKNIPWMNIEYLPSGLYFLRVETTDGIFHSRLIKQ